MATPTKAYLASRRDDETKEIHSWCDLVQLHVQAYDDGSVWQAARRIMRHLKSRIEEGEGQAPSWTELEKTAYKIMTTLDPSRAGLPTPPESQRAEPAAPPARQTPAPARAAPLAPQTALTASRPARAASSMVPWWERPPVKIYKRPVPLGHEWSKSSMKTSEWRPIPNYVAPKKPVDSSVVSRPVGKPSTGHAWNFDGRVGTQGRLCCTSASDNSTGCAWRPPKNSKFDPDKDGYVHKDGPKSGQLNRKKKTKRKREASEFSETSNETSDEKEAPKRSG